MLLILILVENHSFMRKLFSNIFQECLFTYFNIYVMGGIILSQEYDYGTKK